MVSGRTNKLAWAVATVDLVTGYAEDAEAAFRELAATSGRGGFGQVEHLAVAENLKHQIEQSLGREFAELVGLPLLQRQHLADGRRQAGAVQHLLVFAHAELGGAALQGFDGRVALGDQVMPRPFATLLLDATGQRHRIARKRWPEWSLSRRLAAVVDNPAQPAEILAIAPHVALVIALLRAVEGQQRAQGIEQRGLAGTVGANDGDDGGVERQNQALPEIPMDHLELFQAEHQASPVAVDAVFRVDYTAVPDFYIHVSSLQRCS